MRAMNSRAALPTCSLANGCTRSPPSRPTPLPVASPFLARNVAAQQPDVEEQLTGPSLKVAYKDGVPTQAAEAFARKAGVPVSFARKDHHIQKANTSPPQSRRRDAPPAKSSPSRFPKKSPESTGPRACTGAESPLERFVRPVRWMVSLLDDQVVPVEFGGSRRATPARAIAFFPAAQSTIDRPADYASALAKQFVTVSSADREHRIRKALDAATRTIPGARWREDKSLLDTVVNLTECPSVVLGNFDPEFLTLPAEVLVTVMRDHQKYFALEDADGKLSPHFLAVLNTDSDPDGLIRHGNERVLRARFNDARFFWNTDQKISLRQRVDMLKSVTFQKELGSYFDKTLRVQKLGSLISTVLENAGVAIRPGVVHKAALLCKADLTTDLVKEFTELARDHRRALRQGAATRSLCCPRRQPTPSVTPSITTTSPNRWTTQFLPRSKARS